MPKYDVNNEDECRGHVLWSNHALMRAVEYKIDLGSLYYSWRTALPYELPPRELEHKVEKYGPRALDDRFYFHPTTNILFTVHVAKSGQWFIETVSIRS